MPQTLTARQLEDFAHRSIAYRAPMLAGAARILIPEALLEGDLATTSVAAVSTVQSKVFPLNGFDRQIAVTDSGFSTKSTHHTVARVVMHANAIARNRIDSLFLMNMADAQGWDYAAASPNLEGVPIFQYNRRPSQRHNVILLPLSHWYMGPGSPNLPLPGFDSIPFEKKAARVIWRGAPSGMIQTGPFEQVSLGNFIAQTLRGEMPIESLCGEIFPQALRPRIIQAAHTMPRVDARLTLEGRPRHDLPPALRDLVGDPVPQAEQLGCRYLLALEGNDAPSSMYWGLASNSVVFCPERQWETIMDEGLEPWVHYVPIASDGSDIEAMIDHCEANPHQCADIRHNAQAAMARLANAELRQIVDFEVLSGYTARAWGSFQARHPLLPRRSEMT